MKGGRLSWFRGWRALLALSDLEHVIALATSPRCLGRPRHGQLLLLLGDVGKHRTKALVLDDGSLIDLRPLVEGPIREVHAIVPDRKSAIRIIEDHDPLAGQGSCDLVRLQDKQHLVVLQRQIFGDRAILLPGKGVIEIVIASERTMEVPLIKRRLGEAGIVVCHERRQERIAGSVPFARSTRPLACEELAQMMSMLSACRARPNCVIPSPPAASFLFTRNTACLSE